MPIDKIIEAALALAGLAIVAIITLWQKILAWAQESFFPWMEKNFVPEVAAAMRLAFTWADKNVAVPMRRAVKAAWQKLRPHLLKMAVHFEQKNHSTWIRRMTSWVVKVLKAPTVTKVETEEEVNWDDLPPEVKEVWLKNNQKAHDLDITDVRDQQVEALTMTE